MMVTDSLHIGLKKTRYYRFTGHTYLIVAGGFANTPSTGIKPTVCPKRINHLVAR